MYTVYVVWDAENDLDAEVELRGLTDHRVAEQYADYLISRGAFFAWAERD